MTYDQKVNTICMHTVHTTDVFDIAKIANKMTICNTRTVLYVMKHATNNNMSNLFLSQCLVCITV